MVHLSILLVSLDKDLSDDLHPGIKPSTLDITEHRRFLLSSLHGRSRTVRPCSHANLRPEGDFVRGETVERGLRPDDQDAVVHVDTDEELWLSAPVMQA